MKREDLQEAFEWEDPYQVMLALQGMLEEQFGDGVMFDQTPLTPTQQIVMLIQELDAQVSNGGFHQYFVNYGGGLAVEALDALRTIGAAQTAALLDQAMAVFPGSSPPRDREERARYMRTIGKEAEDMLEALAQQYYRQTESVHALALEHVRHRLDDFFIED